MTDYIQRHTEVLQALIQDSLREREPGKTLYTWQAFADVPQTHTVYDGRSVPTLFTFRWNAYPAIHTSPVSLTVTVPFYTAARENNTQTLSLLQSSDLAELVVWGGLLYVSPDALQWKRISVL